MSPFLRLIIPTSLTSSSTRSHSSTKPALTLHVQPSIYVSDSHDPWFNLAFEDW